MNKSLKVNPGDLAWNSGNENWRANRDPLLRVDYSAAKHEKIHDKIKTDSSAMPKN